MRNTTLILVITFASNAHFSAHCSIVSLHNGTLNWRTLQENEYFMTAKIWLRMTGNWLQSYSWRPTPWGEIWLQNMTASHFWALYFTNIYYMTIGNTKVLHRECRKHIQGTLSHIASHISIVVTFLFWIIKEKYRQCKKNMDKPLFKILKS